MTYYDTSFVSAWCLNRRHVGRMILTESLRRVFLVHIANANAKEGDCQWTTIVITRAETETDRRGQVGRRSWP